MTKIIKLTLAVVLLTAGCSRMSNSGKELPAGAATRPKGSAGSAQVESVDSGAEVSRFVYQKDEIVSVLRNGMTVIVKRVSSPVVSVRGYVRTGGVYEGRWLGGGLSHLLEHLVAGGTNGRRSEAENRNLLQQIGNNSNAYTTHDHTAYFVNTTAADMEKAVDLVSGWLLTATITPEEYRREYEVVQRELEMGEGEPERVFYKLAMRNRYLVSPMRVPTIGYQEVIRGLVLVNATSNPQAGVVIGFDSNTVVGDASVFPLTVADTMTSGYGYPTGYIFEILRGRGLVYNAHGYLFPGRSRQYPGSFVVYAGCEAKNVNQVVEIILENMARLQGTAQDLQVDWFERSKKLTITSDALENEPPAAQATTAALDELFGLGYDYHAGFADNINRVRIPDVQAAAGRMLRQCVVTISTNAPEVVKVQEGERIYDMFPPVDLTPQGVGHE